MNNIKGICFFDLDGTLLNSKSQVDKDVAAAIALLKSNNYLPVIATGRTISSVEAIMNDSGIFSIIALNGQYIEIEGRKIHEDVLPVGLLEEFLDFSKSLGNEVCFNNAYDIWASGHNETMIKAYQEIHVTLPAKHQHRHIEEKVSMLLAITENKYQDELYAKAFPELNFFRNSQYSIDIVAKQSSKGAAIRILIEELELFDVPTYGFGDGLNDISMMEHVDFKIAMGNAVDEVKELADYITATNTEGGLIEAFKHYGLIDH